MRRAAIALAAFIFLAAAPADSDPARYLAYQIRIARGEQHYRLDAGLSALAAKRAREYALNPQRGHRALVEVPCRWGEVLGRTWREARPAVRWVAAAWRRSPAHWRVISGSWARYGVGAYFRDGSWYVAVIFADCRL